MNDNLYSNLIVAAALIVLSWAPNSPAAETNRATSRIGVYDSRAVAYAHFSTPEHLRQISQIKQAARAAGAAGQTNRFLDSAMN